MSLFQLRQTVLLLITATIWGLSFVAQSVGMDHVGPFTFTASRMFLGALVLLPFVLWNRSRLAASNPAEHARRTSPAYMKMLLLGGAACGLCLFGGESLQQFGLVHDTEVGKAGFITALYIVLVPMIGLALGRRTGWLVWAAVLIAESPTIEGLQGALLPILWAGIMSNGIAYTLQIVGQRGMNETVASLIMSLESAIAVIAGWLLLGEVLSQRELFGCVLMAGAVVLAQLPAPKSRRSGKD